MKTVLRRKVFQISLRRCKNRPSLSFRGRRRNCRNVMRAVNRQTHQLSPAQNQEKDQWPWANCRPRGGPPPPAWCGGVFANNSLPATYLFRQDETTVADLVRLAQARRSRKASIFSNLRMMGATRQRFIHAAAGFTEHWKSTVFAAGTSGRKPTSDEVRQVQVLPKIMIRAPIRARKREHAVFPPRRPLCQCKVFNYKQRSSGLCASHFEHAPCPALRDPGACLRDNPIFSTRARAHLGGCRRAPKAQLGGIRGDLLPPLDPVAWSRVSSNLATTDPRCCKSPKGDVRLGVAIHRNGVRGRIPGDILRQEVCPMWTADNTPASGDAGSTLLWFRRTTPWCIMPGKRRRNVEPLPTHPGHGAPGETTRRCGPCGDD